VGLDSNARLGHEKSDLLREHYVALKEHAVNINAYRGQGMTVLASAFAPVAGSLIALAATGKFSRVAQFALVVSLIAFGFISMALAAWAWRLDDLQRQYRTAMDVLVRDDIDAWIEFVNDSGTEPEIRRQDVQLARGAMGTNGVARLLAGHGVLPSTLAVLGSSAIVVALLLATGTIRLR
jgi:hypothetical protein